METLPYELQLQIFGYLPTSNIVSLRLICRAWKTLTENDLLWKDVFTKLFLSHENRVTYVPARLKEVENNFFEKCQEEGKKRTAWEKPPSRVLGGEPHPTFTRCLQYDDDYLVTVSDEDSYLKVYDMHKLLNAPNKLQRRQFAESSVVPDFEILPLDAALVHSIAPSSHALELMTVQFDRNRDLMITAAADDIIIRKFSDPAQQIDVFKAHQQFIWSSEFRDNILVTSSRDKAVNIWDLTTKEKLYGLDIHTTDVHRVDFHDNIVAAGAENAVSLHDVRTGLAICPTIVTRDHQPNWCVQFDSDKLITSCGDFNGNSLLILDMRMFKERKVLKTQNFPRHLAFDSSRIITGTGGPGIEIWRQENEESQLFKFGTKDGDMDSSSLGHFQFDTEKIVSSCFREPTSAHASLHIFCF